MPLPATPLACDAAVVFPERSAAAGFRDRLRGVRRIDAAGFETLVGHLRGTNGKIAVAAVIPKHDNAQDLKQLLAAVVAAHRPRVVIGSGFVVGGGRGARFAATEVHGKGGAPLRLPDTVRKLSRTSCEPFYQEAGDDTGPDPARVSNPWCHGFAAACDPLPTDAVMVGVPGAPATDSNPDQRNLDRQQSLAGKAGAVLRMVARRPSSLPGLWRRQEGHWEAQERLADLIVDTLVLLAAAGNDTTSAAATPGG